MKQRIGNRLMVAGGGFLIGLIVGYLIWGAEFSPRFEFKIDREVKSNSEVIKVKLVTDGDTIVLENGDSVRLLGIDSTEYGEGCFEEAKQRLEEIVNNQNVKLTSGIEDKDKYGRLLRWVWVGDENINLKLVGEGLAKAYIYGDLEFADDLIDAEALARDENRGCLWPQELTQEDLIQINYTEASKWLGESVTVGGVVDHVFTSSKGNIFINFCPNYKSCPFTAVIFKSDQHRFDSLPDSSWARQEVAITGEIDEYENRAEIIVSSPGQIKISEHD